MEFTMNAPLDFLLSFLFAAAAAGAFGCLGFILVVKARLSTRTQSPTEDEDEDEEFINIALCETRHGIKTHYHDVGVEPLRLGGYPIQGYPTLCGAEVGWDMKFQDAEADCQTCREAFAKMGREAKS